MEPPEPKLQEEQEEQRVSPIATTPPRRDWKEESLSCSSSETQASVTSGISLGEAIRQETAVNSRVESWYQLPIEVDASRGTAASDTKLGLTSDSNDLTDFPMLEEGTFSSAAASRLQSPGDRALGFLLDTQNSRFALRPPLLMCLLRGQRFFDETLFQRSEVDFIPLRGVTDVSEVSEERLKPVDVHEATSLMDSPTDAPSDAFSLFQHPRPFSHMELCDAGGLSQQTSLSGQLPVSKENADGENGGHEEASIAQTNDSPANSTSRVLPANKLSQVEASLVKETCSSSVKDEHFSHDINVPATGFELLEKEKGLLRHKEFSSSENSSCKTALTKNSEKNEREVQKEKMKLAEGESIRCVRQPKKLEKEKVPEPDLSNNLSGDSRKDSDKNSDAQDEFSVKTSETSKGVSEEHEKDFCGSESLKFMPVPEELQEALLDHHQQQQSPVATCEKEFIPSVTSTSDCALKQVGVTDTDVPSSCSEGAPMEVEPGANRIELTISDFSVERGHKVRGISPSFNLVADGSFSVHLAEPNYQSTPGILLKKSVRAEELGALVMKSDIQASHSCSNEETSRSSSTSKLISLEKQHSLQHAPKEDKCFESLKLKYPHTGRIQSLPSLSFLEKVRTWNVSQTEAVPPAVTLCNLGGVSSRRKAYSTIAGSSDNILSIKKSDTDPKDHVSASSREAGSLGSLSFSDRTPLVHPLTRSQSDHVVNVPSRRTSLVEDTPPAKSTDAVQPLEEAHNGLVVSEDSSGGPMAHNFTAEIVSGSRGEDTERRGQSSAPNAFVSGEAVAQLLKEDLNSVTDGQKNLDAVENQSHNVNIPTGHVSMDNLEDNSLDSLNLLVSSREGSQEGLGSAGSSSVLSRHQFSSAEDDNFVPIGATLGTPEKEELNIEERIPIYLRNLGIDQSPGTILMPFVPRGPIREVELSPSELRTLKYSTDTLKRTMQQPPQGKSLLDVEITQMSCYRSMSVPMNSDAGSDVLSLRELSPCSSRSSVGKSECQCSVLCHQLETTTKRCMQREAEYGAETSQRLQPVSSGCCSDREAPMLLAVRVQDLQAKTESKDTSSVHSLAGVKTETEVGSGSQMSDVGKKINKGPESDSLAGSLKDINKLLAEIRDIASRQCNVISSTALSREPSESSPVQIRKEAGPEDSKLGKDNVPQLQKTSSWDETVTQRHMREEEVVIKPLSYNACNLSWEKSSNVGLCNSEETVKEMTKELGTGKSVGRSEPEGCSTVTPGINQPALVGLPQSKGSSVVSSLRISELGNPSSLDTVGHITDAAGGSQSLVFKDIVGSRAGGARGSDDSSSGDSLAVRVKRLLRTGSPVEHVPRVPKDMDEEERKSQEWVKLKLTGCSQESVAHWTEEDQRRIEEIKAELLLSAKKSALAKDLRDCGLEAASECSHKQERAAEPFEVQGDKSEEQTQAIRTMELLETSLHQALPSSRVEPSGHCLLKDTQFKSLSTIQTLISSQHQTDTVIELHQPMQKELDTSAVRSTFSSELRGIHLPAQKKLSMEASSQDTAKQITSITFSSRKRCWSPVTSVTLGTSLSRDGLDGIVPLEVDSASTEEESHGRPHWERSKVSPPSSSVCAGSVSKEVPFTTEKDKFHHISAGSKRDGAYQETDCLSDQDAVGIHADERQTLSAKHSDAPRRDVVDLSRSSARVMGLHCDARLSQVTDRLNEPRRVSSYRQEKSSLARHIHERLDGSDPALQTDLLKGQMQLLEEEKKNPSEEEPSIQKEPAREQIGTSQHSVAGEILSTTSVSPSSPTKKVLSCVHITLSSKCDNSELHSAVNTETKVRPQDKHEVNTQPVSLKTPETSREAVSKSASGLVLESQQFPSFPVPVSSADPCLVVSSVTGTAEQELPLQSTERQQITALGPGRRGLKNISSSVVLAKPGKSTSDASTQITTESPEKITFSAEIYVNSQDRENAIIHQSLLQKSHGLPNSTATAVNKVSSFPRQGDQPLLLPYKPSGSSSMYYVPYLKSGAKISSAELRTSAESSHSGLNDALPPRFLANMFASRADSPPDSLAVEHKEGISSKRAKPKLAWAEEQMVPPEVFPERPDHLKPVKNTQPALKSTQFYLQDPPAMCEGSILSNNELSEDSSGVGHAGPSSSAIVQNPKKTHRHHRVFSTGHKKYSENKLYPLAVEADYSKNEDLNVRTSLGGETSRKELLQQSGRQTTRLTENMEKDLPPKQRPNSSGSLDELWMKFLERQKRHQQWDFRSNGELSLVERLERLARVLQNPMKLTLMPTKAEENVSDKKIKGREQKKIRLLQQGRSESNFELNEKSESTCEERPHVAHHKNSFVELRKSSSGEEMICHVNKILEHQQFSETSSSTTISSTISESDTVTQTETETVPQAEVSSSTSTIDTARLIRAFGHGRVQVSPRLSQLYCTIDHQKSRSGKWDEDVEYPKVTSERHRKRKETQNAASRSWDSTSTSSSSWVPSSALCNKRRTQMLHKGVQAGDLEIVNSATKRNTRDVGVTFPTPRPIQLNQQPQEPWHRTDGIFGESDGVVTDHQAAGSTGKQKVQPGNFFVEKRTKRSRLHQPQGVSWFVQADDLKSESRKENYSNSFSGPGSSWFEPWTSTKPWREPLREKNWQEQQPDHVFQSALPERDSENRPSRPFVKLTLQEALAMHRPDFISRSGERVKHLKLVMEERKIQSELQAQREELFNPPEKRRDYRSAGHMLSQRGFLIREKRRTIPRSEMIQRSKRIYEQLPEVQKKREEEKRKMEYNSYRLKAQQYKTKITNRVLGRKVPWS